MSAFHDPVLLYTNTLSPTLNDTIINCIPIQTCLTFFPQLCNFMEASAQNEPAINTFNFISDDLSKVAKNHISYPLKNDNIPSSNKVDVKLNITRNHQQNSFTHKPFCLCTFKGFEDQHYPLGKSCGAAKLSSKEIINVLSKTKGPTCGFKYYDNSKCKDTFLKTALSANIIMKTHPLQSPK